jgi:hypothetical protein
VCFAKKQLIRRRPLWQLVWSPPSPFAAAQVLSALRSVFILDPVPDESAMAITAAPIENALPGLGHYGALDIVTAASALAATLWQVAHSPEALAWPTQKTGRSRPSGPSTSSLC